jgi:diguanylate cyclase (GGDEF)-like protein/PAS domain S-box-containing protein
MPEAARVGDGPESLDAIVTNAPLWLFALDRNGVFTFSDGRGLAALGLRPDQLVGASVFKGCAALSGLVAQARRALAGEALKEVVEAGACWLEIAWTPVQDCDGQTAAVGVAIDITEHMQADRRLRAALEREHALAGTASDAVVLADQQGRMIYVNSAFERIFGYPAAEAVGQPLTILMPDSAKGAHAAGLARYLATGQSRILGHTVGVTGRHRDGAEIPVELSLARWTVGGQQVFAGRLRDITDRRALEDQLLHQALHDAVTGLPNRAMLRERLERALARRPTRSSRMTALLLADLDDFSVINDRLGHAGGDQLLAAVTGRLAGSLREGDTLARVGGDEFAVLVEDTADRAEALATGARLAAALQAPVRVGSWEVPVRASIGIAVSAPGAQDADELLRQAEVAVAVAKDGGKARVEVFAAGRHTGAWDDLTLRTDLETAIAQQQFRLRYQPLVALDTGRLAGVEVLVRWEHPTRGLLGPAQFIPLAERTGLIVPLGRLVLEQACRQARRWHDEHPDRPLGVSVNLSARELDDDRLVPEVAGSLERSGLDPATVTLELTETVLMRDAETAADRLRELKRTGVRLAVDDFGTGYSSLGYLDRLPVDVLKIDKTFIDRLGGGGGDGVALVGAILRLAQTFGLETVAEGVERPDQASQLRALGCHYAQGYCFAQPLPAQEVDTLIIKRASAAVTMAHAAR